ncbi:hypothetical protein SNE40_007058 [Patella caerulea]|uniref:Probable arginine--tRNA ligase, mitochondrial n=1 Tax=Patella caerulea TaxID=87958 RepID=A0AAN8JVU1_PATCE
MSACLRRIIVNRIARSLRRNGEKNVADIEKLEVNLLHLLKVNPVSKNTKSDLPQFLLPGSRLKEIGFVLDKDTIDFEDDVIENCYVDKSNKLQININNKLFIQKVLSTVQRLGKRYGYDVLQLPKKHIVVEYSSPNIAKPFHVGHLHSTILGNFISNLYEALGHKVTRLNYLGDWGTQLSLLILGYKRYGDDVQLNKDPLQHLFEVYVKIHEDVDKEKDSTKHLDKGSYHEGLELFHRLESGDEEITRLWKKFSEISLEEYDKMYKRLNIRFDEIHTESMYNQSTQQLIQSLKQSGLIQTRKDGVGYIDISNDKDSVQAVMNKSDGSTLYLSRDIAAALDRFKKFKFDKIHYVVGNDQYLHFKTLLEVLKKIHPAAWKSVNLSEFLIKFGRVDGISTRKGNVVFLRDILDEARDRVIQSLKDNKLTKITSDYEDVADKLGISSIIIQYLRSRRTSHSTFNWEKMLHFKADSGLFLQYCHARLYSLEKEVDVRIKETIDISYLSEDSAKILVQHLARYPDVVNESFDVFEPYVIVQYLFKLGHLANSAYKHLPVKNQPAVLAETRLVLFNSARQTLANGMRVLGIEPLNQM